MKEVIVLDTVWNHKLIDDSLFSTGILPLTIGDRWHGLLKGVDRQGNTVEYDCEATICEY